MDELKQTVLDAVSNLTGVPAAAIEDEAYLVDDLQMDSIELVQLGLDLEEALGIEVPDSAIRSNCTVGELVEAVRQIKQPA